MSTAILSNLHLQLVQGDDYIKADGRAVTFRGVGVCWPVPEAARLLVYEHDTHCATTAPVAVIDVVGEYQAPAEYSNEGPDAFDESDVQWQEQTTVPLLRFDVPRSETLKLLPGVRRYAFEARGLLLSGSVVTMARGVITVLESVA